MLLRTIEKIYDACESGDFHTLQILLQQPIDESIINQYVRKILILYYIDLLTKYKNTIF